LYDNCGDKLDTLFTAILIFVTFWTILLYISSKFDLSEKNVEIAPFQIIMRTKKLTNLIDAIAQGARPFWRLFAYVGVVVAASAMILTVTNFIFVGSMLLNKPSEAVGVTLVIPGVTLPLMYSLVGLVTVVFVHEFAHGIIARLNNIPLKSVGAGIFAILPFAFVEPDEEGMKETTPSSRVQVYAAGSMANLTLALVVLGIMFVAVIPQLSVVGLSIGGVEGGSPAEIAGLEKGMVIEFITFNGETYKIDSYGDFVTVMDKTHPGDPMTLMTNKGTYDLLLSENPQKGIGFIGVTTYDRSMVTSINPLMAFLYPPIILGIDAAVFPDSFSSPVWIIINCLKYIFFLNVGIGLFNMLPIGPIDGGRIFKEFTDKLFNKRVSGVVSLCMSLSIVLLIVASLVVPKLF